MSHPAITATRIRMPNRQIEKGAGTGIKKAIIPFLMDDLLA